MISATVLCDSKNEKNCRLTTFILEFPRIVLAEFNTHRALSRSSASSRAIPFDKMMQQVESNPFIPIRWMKEHKGMQGTEYFEFSADITKLTEQWLVARDSALDQAITLSKLDVTKQICNRLIEPFLWHKVIVTATDFENFFALRAEQAAEIHIQELAYRMLQAYNESTPITLKTGDWHIPFGDKMDNDAIIERSYKLLSANTGWTVEPTKHELFEHSKKTMIQIAIARCARISYNNFDGNTSIDEDLKLYARLVKNMHLSPLEHVAMANNDDKYVGNFRGFIQQRKMVHGENRSEKRVIQK